MKFAADTVLCRLFWMAGKCSGMATTDAPAGKVLLPQSNPRFAGYSLRNGAVLTADFGDDQVTVSAGNTEFTARRK
ncbi:MAG: hypothetical protein JSV44_04070 [Candidatus Zixiibacteriota bacterium]|nr:MAG: hypothetical protein JSV44_04070 [candidate division Zixibacteria bacterium]